MDIQTHFWISLGLLFGLKETSLVHSLNVWVVLLTIEIEDRLLYRFGLCCHKIFGEKLTYLYLAWTHFAEAFVALVSYVYFHACCFDKFFTLHDHEEFFFCFAQFDIGIYKLDIVLVSLVDLFLYRHRNFGAWWTSKAANITTALRMP